MSKLFVTDTCPGCTRVKTALAQRPDVAQYVVIRHADKDPVAQKELLALGVRVVPTLLTSDGRVITNDVAIKRELGL